MENLNYENEEWRDIKGYEGHYQVSNYGRVKSLDKTVRAKLGSVACRKGRIIKQRVNNAGYIQVTLSKNNICKVHLVHRLVAFAFPDICGEWFEGAECNHKNEIKNDNIAPNIEWCSKSFNNNYGSRNMNIIKNRKGKTATKAVLQYSLSGELIREWNSASEVQRETGHRQSCISACARGKYKQSFGYIWKFKDAS